MIPSPRLLKAIPLSFAVLLGPVQAAPADCMDTDPTYWLDSASQIALRDRLMSYFACPDDPEDGPYADQVACNYLAGKVIFDIFGYDDFKRVGGGWLTANEMAAKVERSGSWRLIGDAGVQSKLDEAATAATAGNPVIAIVSGNPGHVALILPGSPRRSPSWNLNAPNSASFSLNNLDKAYAFCRLSYAFASPNGVKLYSR